MQPPSAATFPRCEWGACCACPSGLWSGCLRPPASRGRPEAMSQIRTGWTTIQRIMGAKEFSRGFDDARSMKAAPQSSWLAVYDGTRCVGHIIKRGRAGVEAFDTDDRPLGLFPD